jgi:three-Cys-motif partner protein
MSVKDLHNGKEFHPGTIAKLDIFENYLTEWLPTFLFTNSNVTICDFFSGPGEDILHNPGSPLRIFSVLQKYKKYIQEKAVNIDVVLNEQKKSKFETLQRNVQKQMDALEDNFRRFISVKIYNRDFPVLFSQLESELTQGPNLFFFDQNGVKQITVDFIRKLEGFNKTDYLFFLSSSYFKRFEFEHLFPDLNIRQADIDSKEIHRKVVEKLRDLLPEDSKTKLYHFSIKKDRNIYGLVFGATHLLAVEKFLKVAWNENKINGEANFDIDQDLDTQMDLFSGQTPKATKLQRFEAELKAFAEHKKQFSNKDVFHYTLEKGFTPQHANEILRKLRDDKYLKHFSHAKIGYKQIYTDNEIITFEYIK